jgi:hypothetical protein
VKLRVDLDFNDYSNGRMGLRCPCWRARLTDFRHTREFTSRKTNDIEVIAGFCRRHHIRELSLFGSVLRDDFRPESDVDVLVEFEPGAKTA